MTTHGRGIGGAGHGAAGGRGQPDRLLPVWLPPHPHGGVTQIDLLDRQVASLDPNPEWEEAWAQEADRREALIEGGESQWFPGEEVVAKLRAELS